ncbi:MAG: hypothetical protein AAF125_19250, partial [Chloroflexota bacterium]
VEDSTGAGEYDFKLAGTLNADVSDIYSGRSTWHGYWEVVDAQLMLDLREVSARCNSCLGGGATRRWLVELEQVREQAFSGTLQRDEDAHTVLFERVS